MYESIVKHCIDEAFESHIRYWKPEFKELSLILNCNVDDIEKQVRLHAPLFLRDLRDNHLIEIPRQLKDVIELRFENYSSIYYDYIQRCGAKHIQHIKSKVKGQGIIVSNEKNYGFTIDEVNDNDGIMIESRLHYLRKTRTDVIKRLGVFLSGYDMPICYMSFCNIDRMYQIQTLEKAIGLTINQDEIIQLARVYGFGRLPKNLISKFIKFCSKYFKGLGYKYITTAINPLIGFNGSSMYASDFRPFSFCPVGYCYNSRGLYVSRRNLLDDEKKALMITPPNILLVKGIESSTVKKVRQINKMINISVELFQDTNPLNKILVKLRKQLETTWSEITAYHGTPLHSHDPISKGQCGVTTAFLAKEFSSTGIDVRFCQGNVDFPNRKNSINDHCWLKIVSISDQFSTINNILVDLTADQNGYPASIICDTDENLKSKLIIYNPMSETDPSTISSNSLKARLKILESLLHK